MKEKGYTVVELLVALSCIASIAVFGLAGYVLWHFVAKFW